MSDRKLLEAAAKRGFVRSHTNAGFDGGNHGGHAMTTRATTLLEMSAAMANTTEDTNATRRWSGSNDLLGLASEARWYCLDRDGVAMLCKDEADARAQVIENDDCWPGRAPYRAALLCDLEYVRDGGDLIPLAQPRNEQAKRTAELCLSAWATARMDALEAENAALKRQLEHHKPLAQAVRNVLEEGQLYAEDLALLRQALEQVERALGPNAEVRR